MLSFAKPIATPIAKSSGRLSNSAEPAAEMKQVALSEAEQQSRDRKGGDGQHQRFAQFLELLQERGFFHVSTS